MVDDPDDPDYRYPEPGELYWDSRRERLVRVIPALGRSEFVDASLRALGEVTVEFVDDGMQAIVKLYNLETLAGEVGR